MTQIITSQDIRIEPQPGPQTAFLKTSADICIYGGAAGGGKTYALLIEPLRHYFNRFFRGIIFRRTTTQIRNPGGLWDEAEVIYKPFGASMSASSLVTEFPTDMQMKFAHLEHEKDVFNYQGAAIPYIGFDEITHFSRKQFDYMMSRNRSTSGVAGYIRGTCNPDPDSFVREMIDWYIGEDGYPIAKRSGIVRWFIRMGDEVIWADHRQQLIDKYGEAYPPKSFTFIPSKLSDNKIFMAKDPTYKATLLAMPRVERERLLEGNWNIKANAGDYFRRHNFKIIDALPTDWTRSVRFWDRAATKPSEANPDPDFTVGLQMFKFPNGRYAVNDVVRDRLSPYEVQSLIKVTGQTDLSSNYNTAIRLEQEPGASGVAEIDHIIKQLAGFDVDSVRYSSDKVTRAIPVSSQVGAGNIDLVKGPWIENFIRELESFPLGGHDDQVDAFSGAFNELTSDLSILDYV